MELNEEQIKHGVRNFTEADLEGWKLILVDTPFFKTIHGTHICRTVHVARHPRLNLPNDVSDKELVTMALHQAKYNSGFTHVMAYTYDVNNCSTDLSTMIKYPFFAVRGCRVLAPVIKD